MPLKGVKYDVERFKQKFVNKNFHYIETSTESDTLLSKNYILKWLAKHFKNGLYEVYLFYSGHGH